MFAKFKEEVLKDPRSSKLNFEPDGRNHYVYRVSKDREHYYGSRTDRDNKTIGDGYYTSSNYLEESFKANPEDYKVKIIRRFDNPADKILFESYLHHKFDVKNHDSFINRSNQTPFGFNTTGLKLDQKACAKISKSAKKRKGVGHPRNITIFQFDIKSNVVTEWYSAEKAADSLGLNATQIRVCSDPKRSNQVHGECFWSRNKNTVPKFINRKGYYNTLEIDPRTGQTLKIWDYILNAAKKFKIHPAGIRTCCRGKQSTAGGRKWIRLIKINDQYWNNQENYKKYKYKGKK